MTWEVVHSVDEIRNAIVEQRRARGVLKPNSPGNDSSSGEEFCAVLDVREDSTITCSEFISANQVPLHYLDPRIERWEVETS